MLFDQRDVRSTQTEALLEATGVGLQYRPGPAGGGGTDRSFGALSTGLKFLTHIRQSRSQFLPMARGVPENSIGMIRGQSANRPLIMLHALGSSITRW